MCWRSKWKGMLSKRVLKVTILEVAVPWMGDVLYINLIDDVQPLNPPAFLDAPPSPILDATSSNSR